MQAMAGTTEANFFFVDVRESISDLHDGQSPSPRTAPCNPPASTYSSSFSLFCGLRYDRAAGDDSRLNENCIETRDHFGPDSGRGLSGNRCSRMGRSHVARDCRRVRSSLEPAKLLLWQQGWPVRGRP